LRGQQRKKFVSLSLLGSCALLLLIGFGSCAELPDSDAQVSEAARKQSPPTIEIARDTTTATFPIQIGNDKGTVEITGIKTYANEDLTASHFLVSLLDVESYSITKRLSKSDLIDTNESVHLLDTTNADYLENAAINDLEFHFVRGNTLYFNCTLVTSTAGMEIVGRFCLFYRTKRKGIVYGWYTDELNRLKQSPL